MNIEVNEALFGKIYPFIEDDNVTDIKWNGRNLWINDLTKGRFIARDAAGNPIRLDKQWMGIFTTKLANSVNENFNISSPSLQAETDELRIHAVHNFVSGDDQIALAIRKTPSVSRLKNKDLIAEGYVDELVDKLLPCLIRARLSGTVIGDVGSGKTELEKYLASFIPEVDAIITVEDTLEMKLSKLYPLKDIYSIKVTEDYTSVDAIRDALRLLTKWLILSEARGREIVQVMEAASTGCVAMTSIHAENTWEIPDRVVNMAGNDVRAGFENDVYTFFDYAIKVKAEISSKGIHRAVDQISFFDRTDGVNSICVFYKDGKLTGEELPARIIEKFELNNEREFLEVYYRMINEKKEEKGEAKVEVHIPEKPVVEEIKVKKVEEPAKEEVKPETKSVEEPVNDEIVAEPIVEDLPQEVQETVEEKVEEVQEEAVDDIKDIEEDVNKIENSVYELKNELQDIEPLVQGYDDDQKDDDIYDNFHEIEEKVDDVIDDIEQVETKIEDKVTELKNENEIELPDLSLTDNVVEPVKETISDAVENLKEKVENKVEDIKTDNDFELPDLSLTDNNVEPVKEIQDVVEDLKEKVEDKVEEVKETVEEPDFSFDSNEEFDLGDDEQSTSDTVASINSLQDDDFDLINNRLNKLETQIENNSIANRIDDLDDLDDLNQRETIVNSIREIMESNTDPTVNVSLDDIADEAMSSGDVSTASDIRNAVKKKKKKKFFYNSNM